MNKEYLEVEHNYWYAAAKSQTTLKFPVNQSCSSKIPWLFCRSGLLWCWCWCLCLCVVNCLFAVQVTYLSFWVDSVRIACQALFYAWVETRRKDLLLLDACLVQTWFETRGRIYCFSILDQSGTTLVLGGSGVALVPHVCFAALVLEMFLFVSSINAKKSPKVKKHAVFLVSRDIITSLYVQHMLARARPRPLLSLIS